MAVRDEQVRDLEQRRHAEHPAPVADAWPKLDKPAKVGPGRFQVGVSSRLVVEAAQRQYKYEVIPEKEAIRIAQGKDLMT